MTRISLNLPETYPYSTELTVRIQDINYGNHVGNDAFVSLLHEAKTGIVFFNYLENKVTRMPAAFLNRIHLKQP